MPRLMMAMRAARPEHTQEAVSMVVELVTPDQGGDVVRFELEDGETLEVDAVELRSAITSLHSVRRAA